MVEWKDEYSVGIKLIDSQHKKLLTIAKKLMILISTSESFDHSEEAANIYAELVSYTKEHLAFEERLMLLNGYEGFIEHKLQHDQFIASMDELAKMDMEYNQREAILSMLTFVSEWIVDHIQGTDVKYKGQLKELS
ncbi:MAG: bacteriohemerythrin [Clostridia bacterium]|nr:bacteriohemerythrin [Clostridia bacterium]